MIRQVKRDFSNREGLAAYDFTLQDNRNKTGVSALLRVRNEQSKISHCLKSILPIFDEIVVVDNGSGDRTVSLVRDLQEFHDDGSKIRLFSYPHRLSRCGPEHNGTPADSLRSLVYFNNWSLSHCSFRQVCKWDGDMLLSRKTRTAFERLLQRVRESRRTYWTLSGQTVYRDTSGNFFLSRGEVNREVMIFPRVRGFRFIKKENWESLAKPLLSRKRVFHPVCFFELKFTDEDEFSHWSSDQWPSTRKRMEWQNFSSVRSGVINPSDFEPLPVTFLDDEIS